VDREEIRRGWGLTDRQTVLGFVGRLTLAKAPERFLRLVARLAPRHPDLVGVMIGDGELRTECEGLVSVLGIRDRVRMLGSLSGQAHLPAFDVFVLTSRYEAFPYVLLEASAAGLPIVATGVGGARTVIRDEGDGVVVPNGDDADVMARAVESVLRRAGRGRPRAGHRFPLERMVEETVRVYEEAKCRRPKQ
jgi:glycosyltransferase involved in cell wall biosynthesis